MQKEKKERQRAFLQVEAAEKEKEREEREKEREEREKERGEEEKRDSLRFLCRLKETKIENLR